MKITDMTVKRYTVEEMKTLLREFYENHPDLGQADEWYADQAHMTADCVAQFLVWLDTGEYDGGIESEGININK